MTLQAALHDAHSSEAGKGQGAHGQNEKVTMGVIKSAEHRKSTILAPKQTSSSQGLATATKQQLSHFKDDSSQRA